MISDSEHQEMWYQANLTVARDRKQWQSDIAWLKAKRVLIDGSQRVTLHHETKATLLDLVKDRGQKIRSFARSATKAALADWIIDDRLADTDSEIARLERKITEHQPDPRWRLRAGNTLEPTTQKDGNNT